MKSDQDQIENDRIYRSDHLTWENEFWNTNDFQPSIDDNENFYLLVVFMLEYLLMEILLWMI